ncbi:MAG: hypothetical protein R6V25_10015 [Desulfatiglandales bacterium]
MRKIQVITVKADVQVPIAVSTPHLYFAGPSDSVITKTVEIESRDEVTIRLEVLSFDLDDKLTYNIEEVLPGKLFRVTVSTILDKAGTYSGLLKLETTHPKKPVLTIRIRGRIMKRPAN